MTPRRRRLVLAAFTFLNSFAIAALVVALIDTRADLAQAHRLSASERDLDDVRSQTKVNADNIAKLREASGIDYLPEVKVQTAPTPTPINPAATDETARKMAREAQLTADEAYRKALEPCLIHSIC